MKINKQQYIHKHIHNNDYTIYHLSFLFYNNINNINMNVETERKNCVGKTLWYESKTIICFLVHPYCLHEFA